MGESIQKWLGRNRPPRVRITYDVETGGAIEKRELPFVIGLFADLSGDRFGGALPAYALRSMETIDRDNFSDVLAAARPSVALGQVASTLAGDDPSARLTGALTFKSLEDFEPVAVVKAVPALNELYRTRGQIRMMQAAAESGDGLHKALEPLMKLDAAGRAARAPFRSLADPAQRAHLGDRLLSLRKLAMDIALAADDAAAVAAAQAYGFITDAAETSPIDSARQFIGLFAADDTTDNRRAAAERMAALSSYARPDGEAGPAQRKSRAALAQALGLTSDDARQAIAAEATGLSQRLAAAPPDDATPQQRAAQDDAVQAALLHLGILEAEDSDDIDSVNRSTGARVGVRALAERQHLADSRWYANNLLMNTGVVAPADAAPPAADAPAAAVPEVPAAPVSTMQDVLRVLHLFDEAGLATHLDRRQFLPHLGAFAHDILAPLDEQSATLRKWLPAVLAIDRRVVEIDQQISRQLREIMHAPKFQAIEATWRGLHYLVSRAETGKMLKLRVFNATQLEMLEDMEKAVDKDQSHLFKIIYESAYGTDDRTIERRVDRHRPGRDAAAPGRPGEAEGRQEVGRIEGADLGARIGALQHRRPARLHRGKPARDGPAETAPDRGPAGAGRRAARATGGGAVRGRWTATRGRRQAGGRGSGAAAVAGRHVGREVGLRSRRRVLGILGADHATPRAPACPGQDRQHRALRVGWGLGLVSKLADAQDDEDD